MSPIPQKLVLNRRTFASFGSMIGLSNYLGIIDDLFADNHCTKIDIKNDDSPIGLFDESIYYWIDGMQPKLCSNIAFYLHLKHTKEEYIERAVFTTSEKKTLGARYYDPESANSNGYAPYIVFNRIDLRNSRRYFLIVQVKAGENIKIYRFTLDSEKLSQSKFHLEKLPREMASDFKTTHEGQSYSSYHFQVKTLREQICSEAGLVFPCFSSLFPSPQIKSISEDSRFNIEVVNRYPDISSDDYMRYFFLTDPAGRLMALHKRSFKDNKADLIPLFKLANTFWQSRWGVNNELIPRVNDCSYLLLFAENPKYGLFYSHIWLR